LKCNDAQRINFNAKPAKVEEARTAGIDLHEMDDDAKHIVQSHIGRYFEVSAEVIKKRMQKDNLWK